MTPPRTTPPPRPTPPRAPRPTPSRRYERLRVPQTSPRYLPQADAPLPEPPADPAGPDAATRATRATRHLLAWLARRSTGILLAATLAATVAAVIQATVPTFLGLALDSGVGDGLSRRVWLLSLALLGLFCVYAVADTMAMYLAAHVWMRTAFDVQRLVGRHAAHVGAALPRQVSTGEVAAVVAADAESIGVFYERLPQLIGAALSFLVVAVLMLRTSVTLGLVVLVGMPLTAWITTRLVSPLQRRQGTQREAQSALTTITTDAVAGLRILRGIGGEEVFARRYRDASQELRRRGVQVAGVQSVLMSLQVLLPGLFVAVVIWASARQALAGHLSAGGLVTFYGYTAYLSWPLWVFSETVQELARARVGLRKLARVLAVAPAAGSAAEREDLDATCADPLTGTIVDETSGLVLAPGAMTAVVCADPDASAALATRLGRFDDGQGRVTLAGRPLTDMPLAQVRASVVVSGATAELFTGTLREALDARRPLGARPSSLLDLVRAEASRVGVAAADQQVHQAPAHAEGDERLLAALEVADAGDVLSSLEAGLAGMITEKGRSLSGGQRQRVALARALLTEAPTLVLVEPTSALDSHTESRVARRLHRARSGRTTVVVTESPLVLEACDAVVLLGQDGTVRTTGTHRDLLAQARRGDPDALAYRAVVARATGQEAGDPHPGGPPPGDPRDAGGTEPGDVGSARPGTPPPGAALKQAPSQPEQAPGQPEQAPGQPEQAPGREVEA